MLKILKNVIALAIFFALIFIFRDRLQNQFLQLRDRFFPCDYPITYTIGAFDVRFGISRTDFLAVAKQAEEIWEKPIGKDLFKDEVGGNLKVNLLYDYRQSVTEKLQTLGLSVDQSRSSYELIKVRYTTLTEQYLKDRAVLTSKVALLKSRQDAYNKTVAYWNNRRGAPKVEYDSLQQDKQNIQTEMESLNQLQGALNAEVENINALVTTLNYMAKELNLNVDQFNEIGASRGEEFDEGIYRRGADGQSIDIYQYDSKVKLVRVLAHEFGHALGLDHLDNPKAIMYKLNEATNEKLTADDLSALKTHCGIK